MKKVYDVINSGPLNRFVVRGGADKDPMIVHNCTQAIARDILADAMIRAEDEGWNTVLQIHDEIVTEESERTPEELEAIMSIVPPWADGLPIAVEAWKGERFKK